MSNSLPPDWLENGHGTVCVYVKDFRDPLERKKKLLLRPWATIKDIKDQLHVVFRAPVNAQKLFFQGRELKNVYNLQECGIYQDNVIIDLIVRRQQTLVTFYQDQDVNPNASANANTKGKGLTDSSSNGNNTNTSNHKLGLVKTSSTPSSGMTSSSSSSCLSGKPPMRKENLLPHQMPAIDIHPYGAHVLPISLMKVLHQSLQGLALGFAPALAMDGTGGTYFFRDPLHRNVGCFKPQDEEPFGPCNPRGLEGVLGQSGLRRGILSGEACEREWAAYLLDKDHFAGVPTTSLVEARHPVFKYPDSRLYFKMGSLQEFARHDDVVSDLAPSMFTAHQVHKIVLLDMRLLNTDRNDANILVRKKRSTTTNQVEYELIPIDHGYCLPQFIEIAWCDWCWFDWPQLKKPLRESDRQYILSLSVQDEAARLARKIPLRKACRRNFLIAGKLVQKAVKARVLLYDLARVMSREDLDERSVLEKMCLEACEQVRIANHRIPATVDMLVPLSVSTDPSLVKPSNTTSGNSSSSDGSPSGASESSSSPSKSPRPNLRVTIDESMQEYDPNQTVPSGLRSPPGFWASQNPCGPGSFNDSCGDKDRPAPPRLTGASPTHFNWDELASDALSKAAALSTEKPTDKTCFNGTECDKDDFDLMNEFLDENVQEEKAFLMLLFRLMDQKLEELAPPSSS